MALDDGYSTRRRPARTPVVFAPELKRRRPVRRARVVPSDPWSMGEDRLDRDAWHRAPLLYAPEPDRPALIGPWGLHGGAEDIYDRMTVEFLQTLIGELV